MRVRVLYVVEYFFSERSTTIMKQYARETKNSAIGSRYWKSPLLSREPRAVHAVTRGDFNMASTVGPDMPGTVERRRRVCHDLALSFDRLTVGRQVHGDHVVVVDGQRIGAADGLVTDQPDVPLMALSADCCLMTVFDPARPAIGVAHAGWRGTVAGIAGVLVQTMVDHYDARPETLVAAIGPCAGVCCYAVKADVLAAFDDNGHDPSAIIEQRGDATYLNLAVANRRQLEHSGVRLERIDMAGICTICSDDFFSYRRLGPRTGQFALVAAVRP